MCPLDNEQTHKLFTTSVTQSTLVGPMWVGFSLRLRLTKSFLLGGLDFNRLVLGVANIVRTKSLRRAGLLGVHFGLFGNEVCDLPSSLLDE